MQSLTLIAAFFSVTPALAFPGGLSRNCFPSNRAIRPAEAYSKRYQYVGAKLDGLSSTGVGNVPVPAPGDKAHEFQHPLPGAYRGPCPGLNVAANHGFLSRDGVTTFEELVAASQNVYNLGYDISVVLAAVGVGMDGDLDTGLVSIGANASCTGTVDGGGINLHDTFEADMSLVRNDFYLSDVGDDHSFNGTLFKMMTDTMSATSSEQNPLYAPNGIGLYKSQRYDQSRADNGQFHFGANTIIFYGAAISLYELFQGQGQPDYATISTVFGAVKNSTGGYDFVPERLPPHWKNRSEPYTMYELIEEIHRQYTAYYKELGHNEGKGNFVADARQFPPDGSVKDLICFLYDSVTGRGLPDPSPVPVERMRYITRHINTHFAKQGCAVLEL